MTAKIFVIILGVMVLAGSALGQEDSEQDSLIGWYSQHYLFLNMPDSVFTFSSEFMLPDGYRPLDSNKMTDFQQWVSDFPLWHRWRSVGTHMNGNLVNYDSIARVVHMPWAGTRNRDCAVPFRLLAEWYLYQGNEMDMTILPTKGAALTYVDFLAGDLTWNRVSEPFFKPGETKIADRTEYYRYVSIGMDHISYSGLLRNCDSLANDQLRPGDIFVAHDERGKKGVVYVIMNVIQNSKGGELYAVATSGARACDFYIPKFNENRHQPWISRQHITQLAADYPHAGFFRLRQP